MKSINIRGLIPAKMKWSFCYCYKAHIHETSPLDLSALHQPKKKSEPCKMLITVTVYVQEIFVCFATIQLMYR
jgi:hypothetical protein